MAGTTIEDGGHVPAAFGAALAACGISLSDDQRGNVRGASKREAITELVACPGAPARCSLRRPECAAVRCGDQPAALRTGARVGAGVRGRGGRNKVDAAGGGTGRVMCLYSWGA